MKWRAIAAATLLWSLAGTTGAVGNIAAVTVYDRAENQTLPVYHHEGRYYVVGRPGNEYRDGEAGAFEALYARHKGGLYRYLLRQCRNAALAEELFQNVWMNLIRARAGYVVTAKFTTYLYRLAHNRLIDHYRKHANIAAAAFDDGDCEEVANIPDERQRPPDQALDAKRQAERLIYAGRVQTPLSRSPLAARAALAG